MRVGRRQVTKVMLGGLLGGWALLMACGVALAEDWTPPPGAPPGCQPPPGECFPPPEGTQTQPTQTPPQPTAAPTPEAPAPSAPQAPSPTATSTLRQTEDSAQPKASQGPQDAQGSQGPGQGGEGTSPTLVISEATLRIGESVPVPISILGLRPEEDLEVEATITITGGVGRIGDVVGTSLTYRMRASQLAQTVSGLQVTAEAEQVDITIRAYPAGSPEQGISASRSLQALGTSTTPSAVPSPASASTSAPGLPTPLPPDPEQPAPAPTAQARTLALPAYDPLTEPEQTVGTTVAAVALIGATALAAGSVATSLPGGNAPQGPAGGSDARSAGTPGRREEVTSMLAPGDSGSLLAIDTNLQGLAAAAGAASLRRRWQTWRLPLTAQVDRTVAGAFGAAARVSPLLARMIADATYVRAMFGAAGLLLPIAGLTLGILGVLNVQGLAMAPTTILLGLVILLGALDAFAGFIAVAAFTIGIAISGGIWDASSVRTLLGLAILGFGPALIAGASRPMRRASQEYTLWERLADFVVIPLVGAFAVQGTVNALPALSGYDMPIAQQADLLALVALGGLLLRVSLEELASRAYPERIASVAPPDIPPHSTPRRLVLIAVRTFLFGFAAVAFIGNVWQLWVGLAVFAAAELCLVLAPRMPNSPLVFHALPVGVPRFVFIVIVAIGLGTMASLLLQDGADIARTSFVLLLLPGLALAALGMFGKEPRDGDVRWYLRPSMRTLYRVGGIIMVIAAVWLTQFAPVA